MPSQDISQNLRHRQAMGMVKQLALLSENPAGQWIHISRAQAGETYYDIISCRPMHARLNHRTPHFYYKSDGSVNSEGAAMSRSPDGEGFVHRLVKKQIMILNGVSLQFEGRPRWIPFRGTRPEHPTDAPGKAIRIDLVGLVDIPEFSKKFGGGLNLEICCHHPLTTERRDLFRKLPFAAAQFRVPPKMLEDLERQNLSLFYNRGQNAEEVVDIWRRRVNGLIRSQNPFEGLFYIPGEGDPRGFTPQFEQTSVGEDSINQLTIPPRSIPKVPPNAAGRKDFIGVRRPKILPRPISQATRNQPPPLFEQIQQSTPVKHHPIEREAPQPSSSSIEDRSPRASLGLMKHIKRFSRWLLFRQAR